MLLLLHLQVPLILLLGGRGCLRGLISSEQELSALVDLGLPLDLKEPLMLGRLDGLRESQVLQVAPLYDGLTLKGGLDRGEVTADAEEELAHLLSCLPMALLKFNQLLMKVLEQLLLI